MIELALKKGNVALAGDMIRRSADYGHIDANMINIRNHYLQHYYEQVGNYKKAYEYQKHDLQLNDSIRNERVRTRVAELDMRYRQDTIVMRRELVIGRQTTETDNLYMGFDRYCICYRSGTCLLVYEEETHVSSGTAYQPDQPFPYGEYPESSFTAFHI